MLGFKDIEEIGGTLLMELMQHRCTNKVELTIHVSKEDLRKIDEDMYYRGNNGEEKNYVPTEEKLIVKFNNLDIIIKEI